MTTETDIEQKFANSQSAVTHNHTQSESSQSTLSQNSISMTTIIEKGLLVVLLLSVVYLAFTVLYGFAGLNRAQDFLNQSIQSASQAPVANPIDATIPVYDSGTDQSSRDLFSAVAVSKAPAAAPKPVSASRFYRLTGISEGKTQSETTVMVEDTRSKTTYLLEFGKEVDGLLLEQVNNGKATVKIGGASIVLE